MTVEVAGSSPGRGAAGPGGDLAGASILIGIGALGLGGLTLLLARRRAARR
ncbi:hypothetical protein [Microbacterium sp. gxy059]|uniref:hypothetical protein n=1 Tax=Microbacterium sp. gxy059 TaxID=2957199 RepID=UPI003D99F403